MYAVGNRPGENPAGIVVYTKNGGITWDSVNAPNNYGNLHGWIGVKATDTNNVCVYGGRGNFMVTANAGHSWITGGPVSNSDINDLIMLDYHTYWAACDYDLIFITENYGISWTLQPSAGPGNSFLFGISAIDRQNALIVAESAGMFPMGKILKTTDGGKTWSLKYSSGYNLYKIATARL